MSIGERLRNYRTNKQITQEELARLCGYKSRSTINKIEQNINEPTVEKLLVICKVLQITPNELLGVEK